MATDSIKKMSNNRHDCSADPSPVGRGQVEEDAIRGAALTPILSQRERERKSKRLAWRCAIAIAMFACLAGCGPSREELGNVVFTVPDVPGTETPYEIPDPGPLRTTSPGQGAAGAPDGQTPGAGTGQAPDGSP